MVVRQTTVPEAKKVVLDLIAQGKTLEQACSAVGRSVNTYLQWRLKDPAFKAEVERIREDRAEMLERGLPDAASKVNISFEEFRKEYLNEDTYHHHREWIDVIEGRTPDIRPGEIFVAGSDRDRIIVNTPPFHSKSTVITMEYALFQICMNPHVRILIVSKTAKRAEDFLYQIKQRLTDRRWSKLQATFAPEGGFKGTSGQWRHDRIFVEAAGRAHKDPTVEALGIGGHIYGTRADLIILDDVADVANAHLFESHIRWLTQDVESRVFDGKIIIVGTRVGVQDIYSELMNGDRYIDGVSPWTRLAQPAVLQYADDPKDWVTLWPRSSTPMDNTGKASVGEDGLYPAWDGPRLARERRSKSPKVWALVYMQQDSSDEDQTFKPGCVWASVDRRRKPGPLTPGGWGHPRDGGQGMWTIAAMDPAMSGETFIVVMKVDRQSRKRWVEQCYVQASPSTSWLQQKIVAVTDEFGVNEWVIEKNAFQLYMIQDPAITTPLASRGVKIMPHYSGMSKIDPDFGVASVAALFGTTRRINEGAGREVHNKDNLIELPDPDYSQGVKTLIEELLTWVPGKRGKDLRQDGPMALWFAEMRARVILGHGQQDKPAETHMRIPFMSRGRGNLRATPPPALRALSRA